MKVFQVTRMLVLSPGMVSTIGVERGVCFEDMEIRGKGDLQLLK